MMHTAAGHPSGSAHLFCPLAGCEAAKLELWEVVQCLQDAARYSRVRARMPSGVLLSGPPGTGKTLLAKAVAGEAGVPFIAMSASEFVELYVGEWWGLLICGPVSHGKWGSRSLSGMVLCECYFCCIQITPGCKIANLLI